MTQQLCTSVADYITDLFVASNPGMQETLVTAPRPTLDRIDHQLVDHECVITDDGSKYSPEHE